MKGVDGWTTCALQKSGMGEGETKHGNRRGCMTEKEAKENKDHGPLCDDKVIGP